MAKTALNTLKNWFKTGLKPTQEQFWTWMDSFWHKDEKIPMSSVEGIDAALENKADASQMAGKADLVDGKVPLHQLPFGDDVLNFDSASAFPAAGEAGKFYIDLAEDKPYLWDADTFTYKPAGTDAAWKATVDAAIAQIGNKVDAPTTDGNWVLSKLGNLFSWVDASNFGKNVANTLLDTIANAGVNMKANWKIATNNFLFYIEGLADKSADASFNRMMVQNSTGQVAWGNGATLIKAMPSLLSDTEKTNWKTAMNGGWTTNTMSVGLISPPVIKLENSPQWITLLGANLNLPPNSFGLEIMNESGTTVLATVPNSQISLIAPDVINFWFNFYSLGVQNFKLRLWNGVAYYTTSLTLSQVETLTPINFNSNLYLYGGATSSPNSYKISNTEADLGTDANLVPLGNNSIPVSGLFTDAALKGNKDWQVSILSREIMYTPGSTVGSQVSNVFGLISGQNTSLIENFIKISTTNSVGYKENYYLDGAFAGGGNFILQNTKITSEYYLVTYIKRGSTLTKIRRKSDETKVYVTNDTIDTTKDYSVGFVKRNSNTGFPETRAKAQILNAYEF